MTTPQYLILKRTAFGDLVHTLPVVTALKEHQPAGRLTWITEPQYVPFLEQFPAIDNVVPLSFRKLFKSDGQKEGYFRTLGRLRQTRFDAVLDFQGRLKSAFILMNLRSEETIGFNKINVREGLVTRFYSRYADPMPYRLHIIRQNLKLLEMIGIEQRAIQFPAISFQSDAAETVESWLDEKELYRFAIINPFTSWETKNWPRKHVIAFCRRCREETGLRPVLLWGPPELDRARQIITEVGKESGCILAPPTNLQELSCFLDKARLYVGGDTGPSHLSAALGVKTLYLFGPTDPLRNGPFHKRDSFLHAGLNCSKCSRDTCQGHDHHSLCMEALTPDMVFEKLSEML
jgi:heptosyltransferase-1